MNKEQKQNYVPWVIVGIVVIAFIVYVLSSKDNSSDQSINQPSLSSRTTVVSEDNQAKPTQTVQQPSAPKVSAINYELSQNPQYLYSKSFNPNKVKVYGVGIGDSVNSISSIVPQQEYGGWVRTTNGTAYRIVNGQVDEIALNNDGIANLISDNEIIIKFGDPEKTTQSGTSPYLTTTYYYISRGIVITDYQTGGIKVNIIGN